MGFQVGKYLKKKGEGSDDRSSQNYLLQSGSSQKGGLDSCLGVFRNVSEGPVLSGRGQG